MKQIIFALSLVFFVTSCSTTKKVVLNYDKTNPVRIELANQGLDLTSILPAADKVDGTIAIKSIEGDQSGLDVGVVYSIEDNLVANLLKSGYKVVERDPDALNNLYKEESTRYSKNAPDYRLTNDALIYEPNLLNDLNPDQYLVVVGEDGKQEVSSEACCDKNNDIISYIVEEHKSLADTERKVLEDGLVQTGLNASDYVLSYRVLECGVNYYELKDYDTKYERSARTRLHCRLTDSKTSEIVAAGLVEHEVIDLVKKADVKALQQMSYQYYHHTLPNMRIGDYREETGYAKANEEIKPEKASKRERVKENSESKKGLFSLIWPF